MEPTVTELQRQVIEKYREAAAHTACAREFDKHVQRLAAEATGRTA